MKLEFSRKNILFLMRWLVMLHVRFLCVFMYFTYCFMIIIASISTFFLQQKPHKGRGFFVCFIHYYIVRARIEPDTW